MIIRAMCGRHEDSAAMAETSLGILGLGLTGFGILQVVGHLSPLLPIYASLCGGAGSFTAAHAMLSEGGHCAGCPMALVGIALLGASLAVSARSADDRAGAPAFA